MAETTAKKPRAKRRNYERELSTLRLQCEVTIETLTELNAGIPSPSVDGQLIAYRRILGKIDGGNGK